MKAVVLLLLLNAADGSQEIISQSQPVAADECHVMESAIWHLPDAVNHTVYVDEAGPVQRMDAACVVPSRLSDSAN